MQNIILVNSHRRSGTHFLIDSLRANIPGVRFPGYVGLPTDFNIGCLHAKSDRVYNIFQKELSGDELLIIKSHLLPEEMNLASPSDKHEQLIKDIYQSAKKIYIKRDGKDTLVSLFHFLDLSCSFSDFLRTPNEHISKKVRNRKPYDKNRVVYWGYHVATWEQESEVKIIKFGNLKRDFDQTIAGLTASLDVQTNESIQKPQVPANKWWHAIRMKLAANGMVQYPESSSVRPRKGTMGQAGSYYTPSDHDFFDKELESAEQLLNSKEAH